MKGPGLTFLGIGVILNIYIAFVATTDPPISSIINFQSNLALNSPDVRVNCRNSYITLLNDNEITPTTICPTYSNYWLKHSVLSPTQEMTLSFIPGDSILHKNNIWCWNCNFEWGLDFVIKNVHIFPESLKLEEKPEPIIEPEDLNFQLRSDGLYKRIQLTSPIIDPTLSEEVQEVDEDYILVKKWLHVGNFTCEEEGRFRDPVRCNVFHVCEAYDDGYVHNELTCAANTVYCEGEDQCGYEYECPCY